MEEKNLVFLKTKTLGSAYAVANQLAKQGCVLIEAFAIGGGGHLLMEFKSEAQIDQLGLGFKTETVDMEILHGCPIGIYKTYLSLENSPVQAHALVLDFDFIGKAFKYGKELVGKGLKLVDLRLMRGIANHSYLIATGDNASQLKTIWTELQEQGIHCHLIEDLHPDLKQLL